MFKYLALGVLFGFASLGYGADAKECTTPPFAYVPGVVLKECSEDEFTARVACSYTICMNDPAKFTWCGLLIMERIECDKPFLPVYIGLAPKPEKPEIEPPNFDQTL